MPDVLPIGATHKIHGVIFKRSGECNRCPATQPAPCCLGCPHFEIRGGKNTCMIYNKRADVCTVCSAAAGRDVTHQVCIDFPSHPWLRVCTDGLCCYVWEAYDTTEAARWAELNVIWKR